MIKPVLLPVLMALAALGLAACDALGGEGSGPRGAAAPAAVSDPVVARALYDPLMSDPDLSRRSEANAAIGFADSRALPVLPATPDERQRARDAMRAELLTGGAIPALSPMAAGSGGQALGELSAISEILTAAGAPDACRSDVRERFDWAAKLPPYASVAPLGMVEQAAGRDAPGCTMRAVRYLTAAPLEDVMSFHDTLAQRAGLRVQRYAAPEAMLVASDQRAEALRVHLREQTNGMTAVDLVFWINP